MTNPPPNGNDADSQDAFARALLLVVPVFWATNMLTARAVAGDIPPVALAFWRWTLALLIMMPFVRAGRAALVAALRTEWRDLLILGALGMGVCGVFVYVGAQTTTATNIGLIYAASPVLIILMVRAFYGEAMTALQGLGVLLCLAGVIVIVIRGDIAVLTGLAFTAGDLWILGAAIGWALYSILLRYRPSRLDVMSRLAAITLAGVVVIFPFMLWEGATAGPPAADWETVGSIVILAIVPGVLAYQSYSFIQRRLGASRTGLILYLVPVYNAGLAWAILGEEPLLYHLTGAAMVLPGIFLATGRRH